MHPHLEHWLTVLVGAFALSISIGIAITVTRRHYRGSDAPRSQRIRTGAAVLGISLGISVPFLALSWIIA
jgi:hypothetical protein